MDSLVYSSLYVQFCQDIMEENIDSKLTTLFR